MGRGQDDGVTCEWVTAGGISLIASQVEIRARSLILKVHASGIDGLQIHPSTHEREDECSATRPGQTEPPYGHNWLIKHGSHEAIFEAKWRLNFRLSRQEILDSCQSISYFGTRLALV